MATPTLTPMSVEEIEEAINQTEAKKQALKTAFEALQTQSHSLTSFTLTWHQIDTHFTQIHSSLSTRLAHLQQKEQSLPKTQQNPHPNMSELTALCEKMDAEKVRTWLRENLGKWVFKSEDFYQVGKALGTAVDPYKLVLDCVESVRPKNKSCLVLLEGLMVLRRESGVEVGDVEKERAKCLAVKWRGEIKVHGKYPLDVLGFLRFVVCFGLVGEFDKDDVAQLVYVVGKNPAAARLCRDLGLVEQVPALVQKFVSSDRPRQAIKFVYEFNMQETFPPVELLKSFMNNARKLSNQLRQKGKTFASSYGLADSKEINASRTVLKCIGEYNLASEYPPDPIKKRIKHLEELRENRKKSLAIQPPKSKEQIQKLPKQNTKKQKQKLLKQKLRKRSEETVINKTSAAALGVSTSSDVSTLPPSYQPYMQPGSGSSLGPHAGFLSNAPYADSVNLLHGLANSLVAYTPSSSGSHLYASGSLNTYQGLSPLGDSGFLPQHPSSYYPQ